MKDVAIVCKKSSMLPAHLYKKKAFCLKQSIKSIEVFILFSDVKNDLLHKQKRSFRTATVEMLQAKPILIDDEDDEQISLDDLNDQHIELLKNGRWVDIGHNKEEYLRSGGKIRIKKTFPYAFHCFLNELDDESFIMFVHHLNALSFSVYDIIYCHNQLLYHHGNKPMKGASVFIFDNTDSLCAVQHFFHRGDKQKDLFEFTVSTGERSFVSSIS
jgi:hypothetical protein